MKRVINFLLIMLLCSLTVLAYGQTAEIKGEGANPYKSVRLTPEIYHYANSDLSDILIKNEKGENLPYFIYGGREAHIEEKKQYPMELIDVFTKEDAFYMDYKVSSPPEGDVIATSLVFETQSVNFAKEVVLLGSHDNQHWEEVGNDTLYNVEDKEKLEILFSSPQKYAYYRLQLGNNLERISFENVFLNYDKAAREVAYFKGWLKSEFTVVEEGKDTLVNIEEVKNLKITEITIETDSSFKRKVSDPFGGTHELYNLSFEDVVYRDTTILLDGRSFENDIFTLRISNYDDKPIKILGVTVCYDAEELVFAAGDHTKFLLEFGNNPQADAPIYDITSYKAEILKGEIDQLSLGQVMGEPSQEIEGEKDYLWIFNGVLFLVAALLVGLILLRLRKNARDDV